MECLASGYASVSLRDDKFLYFYPN